MLPLASKKHVNLFLQEVADSFVFLGSKCGGRRGVFLGQVFELWLHTPFIAFHFGWLGRCRVAIAGFRGVSQGCCWGIDRGVIRDIVQGVWRYVGQGINARSSSRWAFASIRLEYPNCTRSVNTRGTIRTDKGSPCFSSSSDSSSYESSTCTTVLGGMSACQLAAASPTPSTTSWILGLRAV